MENRKGTPGKYVVWAMAAIALSSLVFAFLLARTVTPQARQFHETHSPHP